MFFLMKNFTFPAIASSLHIQNMQGNLREWSIPLIHGFKLTPKLIDIYTIKPQSISEIEEKLFLYSGFIEGKIVCSLSLAVCGAKARLEDIATIPSHQRKGYATQLIYAALKDAQQQNVQYCILKASDSGLSLYKKIGFNIFYASHYSIAELF